MGDKMSEDAQPAIDADVVDPVEPVATDVAVEATPAPASAAAIKPVSDHLMLKAAFTVAVDAAAFFRARIKHFAKGVTIIDKPGKTPETFIIGDIETGFYEVRLKEERKGGDKRWKISPFSNSLREKQEKSLSVAADAPIKMVVMDAARRLAIVEADSQDQTAKIMRAIKTGALKDALELREALIIHGDRRINALDGAPDEEHLDEDAEPSAEAVDADGAELVEKDEIKPPREMTLTADFYLEMEVDRLYAQKIVEFAETAEAIDMDGELLETFTIGDLETGFFEARRDGDMWHVMPFSNSLRKTGEPAFSVPVTEHDIDAVHEVARRLVLLELDKIDQTRAIMRATRDPAIRDRMVMEHAELRHGQRAINIGDGVADDKKPGAQPEVLDGPV